jgi:lipopolysaccharide export system protein LptA
MCLFDANAQKPAAVVPPRPSQASDTVRVVIIKNADRFEFKTIDSVTELQILIGHVNILQGKTTFIADSVVYNEKKNYMEAFGNVHINDADSINIYSQYLKYEGSKKIATFKKNVKLTDGNSTLYTEEMDYDMNGKVGTYRNGGRIDSKQTTLYSKQGFYYADIKDVYFFGDVKMSDPEVALASDSLLYNTTSEVATFIAPTTIKSGNSISNVRSGYYDLKTKKAVFAGRSAVRDSTSTMIADNMVLDDKTGFGEAKGNVQFKDTAQGILLFSNRVFFNKTKKNFLATEKPVMVVVQEKDSIYISADTIYSGLMKDLEKIKGSYIKEFDTLKNTTIVNVDSLLNKDTASLEIKKDSIVIQDPVITTDTLVKKTTQTVVITKDTVTVKNQPTNKQTKSDRFAQRVTVKDSTTKDSIIVAPVDSTQIRTDFKKRSKEETDTIRFITAFRKVRIYNDSLQAVADSMFYSGVDSVFQLFREPIAWSRGSQVTGDTIFVYTQNKKPSRLFVFENAMVVQSVKEEAAFFNQVKGRTINAYFKSGELEFVKAKGSAESIYYAQDQDSAFVGMNRTTADIIDMYFNNREAKKVKFTSSVKGITYPIRKIPEDRKKLDSFQWLENKRPKNKLDLFQ